MSAIHSGRSSPILFESSLNLAPGTEIDLGDGAYEAALALSTLFYSNMAASSQNTVEKPELSLENFFYEFWPQAKQKISEIARSPILNDRLRQSIQWNLDGIRIFNEESVAAELSYPSEKKESDQKYFSEATPLIKNLNRILSSKWEGLIAAHQANRESVSRLEKFKKDWDVNFVALVNHWSQEESLISSIKKHLFFVENTTESAVQTEDPESNSSTTLAVLESMPPKDTQNAVSDGLTSGSPEGITSDSSSTLTEPKKKSSRKRPLAEKGSNVESEPPSKLRRLEEENSRLQKEFRDRRSKNTETFRTFFSDDRWKTAYDALPRLISTLHTVSAELSDDLKEVVIKVEAEFNKINAAENKKEELSPRPVILSDTDNPYLAKRARNNVAVHKCRGKKDAEWNYFIEAKPSIEQLDEIFRSKLEEIIQTNQHRRIKSFQKIWPTDLIEHLKERVVLGGSTGVRKKRKTVVELDNQDSD